MLLPHLLRFFGTIIVVGVIVVIVSLVFLTILIPHQGVLKGHPWPRRLIELAPFAYPLLCWALFAFAARHDRRLEQDLRTNGVAASATLTTVRDLGVTVGVSPLLLLQLRVQPRDAGPFDTELSVKTSRLQMHAFQPGKTLRVRYDPADPSRIIIE